MTAPAGFTSITGTRFQNASGAPLAAGRINCSPVNNTGQSVSATAGGGGMIAISPVTFLVVNGAITTDLLGHAPVLADTTLTTPPNIGYSVAVVDTSTNAEVQGPGWGCVQPSGATWSFDTFVPNQPALVVVQQGPPGEPGPATVVTENGADGNFTVAGELQGKTISGEWIASQNQSAPTTYNGLANAIVAAGPGGRVQLDPSYLGTETPYEWFFAGTRVSTRSYQYPLGSIIRDRRPGSGDVRFAYGINNGSGTNGQVPFAFIHSYHDNGANPTNSMANVLTALFNGAPSNGGYGTEGQAVNHLDALTVAAKSIAQNTNATSIKTGVGDFGGSYHYISNFGGSQNGDDEGVVGQAIRIQEGTASAPAGGTISAIGTDANGIPFLRLNATSSLFGSGRWVMLSRDTSGNDASFAAFTVTAQSIQPLYTALTVTETIASGMISAVWGTVAAVVVPQNLDVPQSVTLTVTLTGGAAQTTTGFVTGIAMMAGCARSAHVQVTAAGAVVNTSGVYTQTITILVREQPNGWDFTRTNSAMFFQDPGGTTSGLGQSVGRLKAFDQGLGNPSQAIPVLGAMDAHTVIAGTSCTGTQNGIPGFQRTQPVVIHITLTRAGNVASITSTDGQWLGLLQRMPCTVTCPGNTSFNTTAAVLSYNGTVTTFPSTGADVTSAQTGTISFGVGFNVMKLYRAAETIRVVDPTQATAALGEYVGLEANNIAWTVGDTIESPPHYSSKQLSQTFSITSTQPANNTGSGWEEYAVYGPVADGNFIALNYANGNASSQYSGFGGLSSAPTLMKVGGTWEYIMDLRQVQAVDLICIQLPYVPADAATGTPQGASTVIAQGNTQSSYFTFKVDQQADGCLLQTGQVLFTQYVTNKTTGAGQTTVSGGPLLLSTNQVKEVAAGTDPTDAVTLAQVTSLVNAGPTGDSAGYTGTQTVGGATWTFANGRLISVSS